jgi:hypothetical protein
MVPRHGVALEPRIARPSTRLQRAPGTFGNESNPRCSNELRSFHLVHRDAVRDAQLLAGGGTGSSGAPMLVEAQQHWRGCLRELRQKQIFVFRETTPPR